MHRLWSTIVDGPRQIAAAPLLLLLCAPARALDLADAAKRYDAADFRGASAAYEELLKKEPRSAALHYDLGNALFKSGHVGHAIAEYQRAFDILPRDADIRYNLEFALKRAGEELVPPGVPPVLFSLFYFLSERELAGLQWLACWAALVLASLYLWREPWRAILGSWCLWAFLAWGATGGWWLARRSLEPAERGVITSAAAEIRAGPGENFNVSFTAPEGRRLQILSRNGDWLEIGVLKEGAKGWILASAVETL